MKWKPQLFKCLEDHTANFAPSSSPLFQRQDGAEPLIASEDDFGAGTLGVGAWKWQPEGNQLCSNSFRRLLSPTPHPCPSTPPQIGLPWAAVQPSMLQALSREPKCPGTALGLEPMTAHRRPVLAWHGIAWKQTLIRGSHRCIITHRGTCESCTENVPAESGKLPEGLGHAQNWGRAIAARCLKWDLGRVFQKEETAFAKPQGQGRHAGMQITRRKVEQHAAREGNWGRTGQALQAVFRSRVYYSNDSQQGFSGGGAGVLYARSFE